MISNFSEVEKSLKRCLKEKVSITAATVVGFLIAGTVAFGESPTNVEFKTVNDGGTKVELSVGGESKGNIGKAEDSISVADYEALTTEGALKNLLTVTTEGGVTTFAGVGDLGIVKATATNEGPLTLITTDKANTSITSSLTIEAAGDADHKATAMEALEGHTVTNGKDGDITVGKNAVGMKANAGATAVNADGATITVDAGAGDVDTAIGMSAATDSAKDVTTLTNDGTITVAKGIGISVDGTGEAKVAAGEISVADGNGNVGINIANTGTGKTIVTGGTIKVTDKGTGINAKGNVELEDIAITLNGAGTGIVYTGETDTTVTTANISTKGMTVGEGAAGITATMSKAINSTLDITTGSIETKHASAIGIKITGTENSSVPSNEEKPSTAIVTTTLGETKGTGVDVTGAANNTITVNLENSQNRATTETIDVDGTGVKVTGAADGTVTVNVDQNNLSVAKGKELINIAAVGNIGNADVNINQNVELAEGGNIVKAGNVAAGNLNINLNVKGDGLTVAKGTTALNLADITSGTTSVKNTGTVTIAETGTLLAGSNDKVISLTNQGLITLETVTGEDTVNSKISTGTSVEVANYGTITLKDMDSTTFLEKTKVKNLEDLTSDEVKDVLKTLGVVAGDNFESVGFIKFSDGEVFTAAEMLTGTDTVANLITTSNQSDYKAFGVAGSDTFTLTSENENEKLSNVQFNLIGKMAIGGGTVVIDNTNSYKMINIAEEGQLTVGTGAKLDYTGNILADNTGSEAAVEVEGTGTLSLSNGKLTMEGEGTNKKGLNLTGAGIVNLNGYTIDADIAGTVDGINLQGTINSKGSSAINGTVTDIKDIKVTENGMLKFGADSKIVSNSISEITTIDLAEGNMGVQIGENGGNVLKSSSEKITFKNLDDKSSQNSASGKVVLLTDALTENTEFNLGEHASLEEGAVVANGDIFYKVTKGEGNNWNATFNEKGLIEATGTKYLELNNMYIATQAIHDLLSKDPNVRVAQLDDLYSNNIYSETVKMSLDTLKMNEDAVLSLNVRPKQGEFTAQGKFLFNNTDYDREGVTRDYKVETKNNGLLGALEYGLTDTSSVGFAFSGTKQDLDMKNGASADGDAFYFGLYRNDTFNNIDLTTGLGYMIDRVDAENFIGKDKFDSTALSGYIQGKYNYAIGENLTLSPKARLTVTRFQQDSINNGRMKQEEIKDTMADVELGVELKKGIALETGKMNLLAGASFTTNVAGKDDDYYKVNFISKAGNNGPSTKVKGANLEKNSLKLNIGADVELTNGVFYNGGLSYEFDDEDRDSIGVTLGAGYKF
ncbi:autotransporter domain-containing protein [Fusobacterium ulcerans]|uniref:autotransporter domain-containing protein n=1 Tax=Fusobacterium ulcerans TaxID=861 RepID=UPI003FF0B332